MEKGETEEDAVENLETALRAEVGRKRGKGRGDPDGTGYHRVPESGS